MGRDAPADGPDCNGRHGVEAPVAQAFDRCRHLRAARHAVQGIANADLPVPGHLRRLEGRVRLASATFRAACRRAQVRGHRVEGLIDHRAHLAERLGMRNPGERAGRTDPRDEVSGPWPLSWSHVLSSCLSRPGEDTCEDRTRGVGLMSLHLLRRSHALRGRAGVSPWRRMIAINLARSGGPPPALITSADSRKYSGPMAAGLMTTSAFASSLPWLAN